MLTKLCQCIGLSSILLLVNYADLLGGGMNVRLHAPIPLTYICLAQVTDILLLGVLIFILLAPLSLARFYPIARLLLIIVLPPYLIERIQKLLPFALPAGIVPLLGLVWAAVVLLLLLRYPSWYRRTVRFAGAVGMAFAAFALISIVQLLWLAHWKQGQQQHTVAWAAVAQPPRQHPLLVWIIFDELSYVQVFERRAKDLELPNFDMLRNQSTLFSHVQPAGYKTARIIPILLSGQPIDDFEYDLKNRFLVHTAGVHRWRQLTGSETVFADAQKNGWRTAAVGWYNPYCTIYAGAIDDCYWASWDKLSGPMALRDNFPQNVVSPLVQMGRQAIAPEKAGRDLCTYDVQHRYQTHIDLEQHAIQLLQGDQADFIFLHLAVPHSPNIWSRANDDYTQSCDGSYLDSLALADREMGKILGMLQSSPRWKDTTLIVQGDHGWRIDLWNWTSVWTEEDEAVSRGVFDPRAALLIHQAGQTQPGTNSTAWPLLRVHDVVEQVLHGQQVSY